MSGRAPWPWIAVSAYATVLMWALVRDLTGGDDGLLEVLSEWQTLIAGLATVAALVYAGRQLQLERGRDFRAYLQQHTSEWEALTALEADLARFDVNKLKIVGALMGTRSRHGSLPLDLERWHRLNGFCAPAIDAPLREYIQAAQMYHSLVQQADERPERELSERETTWLSGHMARLIDTSRDLLAAIRRRKQAIEVMAPQT